MGRRYIGIEMGDHAVTHCAPRLQKGIAGEQGGISQAVGWQGGGGFRFYRLGVPVFDETGHVSPGIRFAPLAAHLWFVQTGIPFSGRADSPFLGSHEGVGYYLLYNGILGDKRPNGGNVLTSKILATLPPHDGEKVIFGEGCRMSAERLPPLQKEGPDLKLRFGQWTLESSDDGSRVSATFDVRTLRVVNAMRGLTEDKAALSASDKKSIVETIAKEVLKVAQHPAPASAPSR